MKNSALYILLMLCAMAACQSPKEHTAAAIHERDSVAMMTTYGVNTLISDSGVMKYRVIAERWEVNENLNPPRQIFRRGVFLEQFDEKFHIEGYIQADTGFYFTNEKLWHLVGNVRVKTTDGLRYYSEELYWDQNSHELYSYKFSRVITPEREMQGTYFRSNESMTKYYVSNSKGSFIKSDVDKEKTEPAQPASSGQAEEVVPVEVPKRNPAMPQPKSVH